MNTHFIFTIHLPNRYKTHSFLATLLTFKCSDMVTHVSLSALGWTHIPALNNYFSWSLHTAALQWENKKPKNKIWNQPCAVTCANKIERNVQHLPRDVVIKRWLAWNILKLQYKRSFECFLITFRDLLRACTCQELVRKVARHLNWSCPDSVIVSVCQGPSRPATPSSTSFRPKGWELKSSVPAPAPPRPWRWPSGGT